MQFLWEGGRVQLICILVSESAWGMAGSGCHLPTRKPSLGVSSRSGFIPKHSPYLPCMSQIYISKYFSDSHLNDFSRFIRFPRNHLIAKLRPWFTQQLYCLIDCGTALRNSLKGRRVRTLVKQDQAGFFLLR
jgi:hypothetical protein